MTKLDVSRDPVILTVPGLNNSSSRHWQSICDTERSDSYRVNLGMWDAPNRNLWVNKLNHAVRSYDRPVILAAHDLGCLAVVWWAMLERPVWNERVVGALLVAPVEADAAERHSPIATFGPTPRALLPFPSIVVAGRNDPNIPLERARHLAGYWGSDFVNAGDVGHINAASLLGAWEFGQDLVETLMQTARAPNVLASAPATRLPTSFTGRELAF